MKTGTVEDVKRIYKLLKSLDAEKPKLNILKSSERSKKPEEVSRFEMNQIVNNLAVAVLNYEAGGSPNVGNVEALDEAYQKELPTLRKIFSDKILIEKVVEK